MIDMHVESMFMCPDPQKSVALQCPHAYLKYRQNLGLKKDLFVLCDEGLSNCIFLTKK